MADKNFTPKEVKPLDIKADNSDLEQRAQGVSSRPRKPTKAEIDAFLNNPKTSEEAKSLVNESLKDDVRKVRDSSTRVGRQVSFDNLEDQGQSIPADLDQVRFTNQKDYHKVNYAAGKAAHRELYGKFRAGQEALKMSEYSSPDEEETAAILEAGSKAHPDVIEKHAKTWDYLESNDKAEWQKDQGEHATNALVAGVKKYGVNQTAEQAAGAARDKSYNQRKGLKELAFPSEEAAKNFAEKGVLSREGELHNLTDPNDPRQRHVQGEASTEPEQNWKNAWHPVTSSETAKNKGVAIGLGDEPKHFQALSNHIRDLDNRPTDGKTHLPIISGRHIEVPWFNQFGRIDSNNQVIQENQFPQKDQHLIAARQSLSRAAKAHSLGMKNEAITHFTEATTHANRAADVIASANASRQGTAEQRTADYNTTGSALRGYKTQVGDVAQYTGGQVLNQSAQERLAGGGYTRRPRR